MHLETAAARGMKDAIAALEGPEPPDSVAYLLDWADELARGRTVGQFGVNGFTYEMVEAWARLTDRHPRPHEVEALFTLDVLMRFPDAGEANDDEATL